MKATIYHNPRCSTSRNTFELLRQAGIEPTVVEYLKDPPSRARLKQLIEAAGLSVREAMRSKELLFNDLGLDNPKLTDDKLLDAMLKHPILIQRPIVETENGVRICRPAETVKEIL